MSKKPFFSVVVPVYNKEPHIARSIKSILTQSFTDFELLVVCDPSTDNSNAEVAKFTDPRIRVFHRDEPGPGGYAARNLGIKEAKADWIAFLDADDEWYPEHLQQLHGLQEQFPQASVMGCGCAYIEPENNLIPQIDSFYKKYQGNGSLYLSFKEYLESECRGMRPLNGTTACIKKEIFKGAGGFPAGKAKRGGDVETWLRCTEQAGGVAWGDYLGAVYYRDSVNMVTRTELFLAEVERQTVKYLLNKYTSKEATLLKKFANRRTIAAWRQNNKISKNNFFLPTKLYFTVDIKKSVLWSVLSLLPKSLYKRISKNKVKDIVTLLKKSVIGTLIKKGRTKSYRLLFSPNYLGVKNSKRITYLSDSGKSTFFGYHDKTPFSGDGNKILAMSIEANDKDANSECTPMKIGFFEVVDNVIRPKFNVLAETTTWCWQQGCMLQWSNTQPNSKIYFNKLIDGEYGAIALDINSNQVIQELSEPIYSISYDDKYAVTLNFARLGRLRPGYGYPLLTDKTKGDRSPINDGLYLLDISTGEKKLLVSLAELAKTAGDINSEHYINHATFSPDGKYLVFFHLWAEEGDKGRGLRACVYDLISNDWHVIEDERIISHYCWKEAGTFLATTRDKEMQWQYAEYDLLKGTRVDLDLPFNQDGHPMYHSLDKNIIVTDSYPDKRREQHLCIVDLKTKESIEIATLYSPFAYQGQVRCDLHPRWDREGKYVVVDTTVKGKREMAVVNLNE